MTTKTRPRPADHLDAATAVVEAAETAAAAAIGDVHQARLDDLDAARRVAEAKEAEAVEARRQLADRQAAYAETLALRAAERQAAEFESRKAALAERKATLVADLEQVTAEMPVLLADLIAMAHRAAQWETRRAELRDEISALAEQAAQQIGDRGAGTIYPGIARDGLFALLSNHGVSPIVAEALARMLVVAQTTPKPADG